MFGKQRITNAMHTRLPPFERPPCQADGCTAKLDEPRPFHTEPQGAPGVLLVHCLAKCPKCGAQYKGERHIALGKKTRALDQAFHPYSDEDRALVASLLPKYQQNPQKLEQIQSMPLKD